MPTWGLLLLSGSVFWISGLCFVPAANWVLPKVRGLVYKWGFRPTGPLLHSPSLHLIYAGRDALRSIDFESLLKKKPTWENVVIPRRKTLFERAVSCPLCESSLDEFEAGKKECPRGCGCFYATDSAQGLPVIVFEPN